MALRPCKPETETQRVLISVSDIIVNYRCILSSSVNGRVLYKYVLGVREYVYLQIAVSGR